MSAYLTCTNCVLQKDACARRDGLRAAVKGLGITALKFRCTDRRPLFRVGQRVDVTWAVPSDDESYEETWPATVVMEVQPRFVIAVDDVPSDEGTPAREYIKNPNLYAKVSAGKLRPLDEPDRVVCEVCCEVRGNDGDFPNCYGWGDGAERGHWPRGCVKHEARRA